MAIDPGTLAAMLDTAVRATGVPLVGVSVGDPSVRASWQAQLVAPADPADQATADAVLRTFDVGTMATVQAAATADGLSAQKVVIATVAYVYRATHGGTNPTPAQLQAELTVWRALARALP